MDVNGNVYIVFMDDDKEIKVGIEIMVDVKVDEEV